MIKEIIVDGCSFRFDQMTTYKRANCNLDKKSLVVEMMLDKILSYNEYKQLYSMLLMEMGTDKDLYEFYREGTIVARNMFIDFCRREGFAECIRLDNPAFEVFINSLIVGVTIFNCYDSEQYKAMIRTMIISYFDEIKLFDEFD